jgi:spore maturation protein CgeB
MTTVVLAAGPLDPAQSYEYHNFLKPLENMGCKVIPFDFVAFVHKVGRETMNRELLATVLRERPELVLFVPHTDEFVPEVVDEINRHAPTVGYLFDDMWRVRYSRFWARHFGFITTSDVNGLRKFREAGLTNVIYSPFACNPDVYRRMEVPKVYDVTFVGQYHPLREWLISRLRKNGVGVQVWGRGWPQGMLSLEDMVRVFNQSRINLNLSNCVSWDLRYLATASRPIAHTFQAWRQAVAALVRPDKKTVEQVKGRHFEINACRGFQLSYYVEGLERLYTIGEELAVFVSPEDLVDKVTYYLAHQAERESIASRGQLRTLRDHSMEKRFAKLFEATTSLPRSPE